MSKKDKILDCVVKQHWFEEIKSGRKTSEYRLVKENWSKKIFGKDLKIQLSKNSLPADVNNIDDLVVIPDKIRIRHGMRSNAEHVILFKIKNILIVDGLKTDLKVNDYVYEIQLGRRIK